MSRVTLFAEVLLPLPLKGVFTYRIPHVMNDQVHPGFRVLVPFGRSKKYVGLVKRVHEEVPRNIQVKYIESVLGSTAFVTPEQLQYWEWLASYYLCAEGEVMNAAMPHQAKSITDTTWHPKTEDFIRLAAAYEQEESLKDLFDHAEKRAPRQLELLMAYIQMSGRYEATPRQVPASGLRARVKGGQAVLAAMLKKGVFELYVRELSRFTHVESTAPGIVLNEDQQQAWDGIRSGFDTHDVVLLHGVTSSGKTELYIRLIRECLERGMQVLYLLPEIALTTQIISRVQNHFGRRAGIYHSRFNHMERAEVWNNLLNGGAIIGGERICYDLVLGPRSAVFLPFRRLGLVIIDEEHDAGFKQFDPAPRYHARDAAIYLATLFNAKVLLGSATPSVESFFHARSGKYGYVELASRHGGVMMPEILVADIRKEAASKQMKSHFSGLLLRLMEEALKNKEQVILFQNRRGFSLRLVCDLCDYTPVCHQCDVSMVYHKKDNKLKCHYCGYVSGLPGKCPSCESSSIRMRGFGTEKIEDELPVFFPEAVVARMDLDTTRAKHAYQDIIHDFENRKIDVLIGTQMVSKGLDFNNVGLVGIMNADNMLGFPDFRAHERAFQLMAQVSGRAGRSKKRGKVVIQTFNDKHPVIRQVVNHDYLTMYVTQVTDRKKFGYPPFSRLVQLTLMHRESKVLDAAAEEFSVKLKKTFPGRVLGPEYPIVARVKNLYQKQLLIKLERNQHLKGAKERIMALLDSFMQKHMYRRVRAVINVDPA